MEQQEKVNILRTGMTNAASIGYTIKALRELGYTYKSILDVIHQMLAAFNLIDEKNAEKIYRDF